MPKPRRFDIEGFKHAIRLWTIVLEISVLMASFPSEEIAKLSYRYRTLGLGYANLGAMLMQAGIAYDSENGRAICAALTAILTGESYAASAEMARELGAFPGYEDNRADMLRVIRNHRRAAYDVANNPNARRALGDYEGARHQAGRARRDSICREAPAGVLAAHQAAHRNAGTAPYSSAKSSAIATPRPPSSPPPAPSACSWIATPPASSPISPSSNSKSSPAADISRSPTNPSAQPW